MNGGIILFLLPTYMLTSSNESCIIGKQRNVNKNAGDCCQHTLLPGEGRKCEQPPVLPQGVRSSACNLHVAFSSELEI